MKVIIAGSRNFNNDNLLAATIKDLNFPIEEVVCGGARGADSAGERYALKYNIPIKYFYADWEKYGKAAGMIRNGEMAEYGDFLLAFWNGKSNGTKNMIKTMEKMGKHGKVILFE